MFCCRLTPGRGAGFDLIWGRWSRSSGMGGQSRYPTSEEPSELLHASDSAGVELGHESISPTLHGRDSETCVEAIGRPRVCMWLPIVCCASCCHPYCIARATRRCKQESSGADPVPPSREWFLLCIANAAKDREGRGTERCRGKQQGFEQQHENNKTLPWQTSQS